MGRGVCDCDRGQKNTWASEHKRVTLRAVMLYVIFPVSFQNPGSRYTTWQTLETRTRCSGLRRTLPVDYSSKATVKTWNRFGWPILLIPSALDNLTSRTTVVLAPYIGVVTNHSVYLSSTRELRTDCAPVASQNLLWRSATRFYFSTTNKKCVQCWQRITKSSTFEGSAFEKA